VLILSPQAIEALPVDERGLAVLQDVVPPLTDRPMGGSAGGRYEDPVYTRRLRPPHCHKSLCAPRTLWLRPEAAVGISRG
jgi:hypothetical protein